MSERNYKIDNIRFVAMFLVVFGHMIELFADCSQSTIYRSIYSFHMPLFIFISGYVARFDKHKIFAKFLATYLVFQTLYKVFDCLYMQELKTVTVTYSNPYWFLWYLFVLIIYYLLIPIFDIETRKQPYIVAITFLVAILLGFDISVGYELSLSRAISFLPFFLMGYYSGKNDFTKQFDKNKFFIICSVAGIVLGLIYLNYFEVPTKALYHVQAYSVIGYDVFDKIIIYLTSIFWIIFFIGVIPNKKYGLFTFLGQNTFYVYLFQGFIIKILAKNNFFTYGWVANLILGVIIVFILYMGFAIIEKTVRETRKIINIKFFTEELMQ